MKFYSSNYTDNFAGSFCYYSILPTGLFDFNFGLVNSSRNAFVSAYSELSALYSIPLLNELIQRKIIKTKEEMMKVTEALTEVISYTLAERKVSRLPTDKLKKEAQKVMNESIRIYNGNPVYSGVIPGLNFVKAMNAQGKDGLREYYQLFRTNPQGFMKVIGL